MLIIDFVKYIKKSNLAILFCAFLILLNSCTTKESETFNKVLGLWEIDKIVYQNKNFKDSLYLNTLFFEIKNNEAFLTIPKTTQYKREMTIWDVYENSDDSVVLEIESLNHFFNGIYSLKFFKNEERELLGVELESNDLKIIGYKFHQNYLIDGFNWSSE